MPLITLTPPSAEQSEQREIDFGVCRPSLWLSAPNWAISLFFFMLVYGFQARFPQWSTFFLSSLQPFFGNLMSPELLRIVVVLGVMVIITIPPMKTTIRLLTTSYHVTSRRLLYHRGILTRLHDQIEIVRIRDLSTIEPLWLRPLNLGHVYLHTVDRSHPMLLMSGLRSPLGVKNLIHQLSVLDRQRLGYREIESTYSEMDN